MTLPRISTVHQRVIDRQAAPSKEAYDHEQEKQRFKEMIDSIDHAAAPKNNLWDAARRMYTDTREQITRLTYDMATFFQDYVGDAERRRLCKDPGRLAALISQLDNDTQNYLNELDAIYKRHEQYTGGSKNPEEHWLVLEVNEEYRRVATIFHTNVNPMVAEIHELMGTIDTYVKATEDSMTKLLESELAKRQADLQDPNVVSDVTPVEKPADQPETNTTGEG